MRQVVDLHIHSRFSRACSKDLTFPNLAAWAAKKGIDILGTGDFTHPAWRREMDEFLVEKEQGLFALADGSFPETRFLLTSEIACIYKHDGKVRRVHHVLCAPSLAAVDRVIAALETRGANLKADGRPIIGMSSHDLLALCLEADPATLLIPAHAWTPWFAVFGSESGYDSLEECFGDLTPHVHAIETGLSSDPSMNWRLSGLDRVMLVSNSDAHSLRNLGREANEMDLRERSFAAFAEILVAKDRTRFLRTLEFFPEEGKYHVDGHRACGVRLDPAETKKLGGRCPTCGRQVTVGVLHRVDAIADRPVGARPPDATPFTHLIPLEEIVAEALGRKKGTKGVLAIYDALTAIAPEFRLLLDFPIAELAGKAPPRVLEAMRRVREEKVTVEPGYDGEYGTVRIFSDEERKGPAQGSLALE